MDCRLRTPDLHPHFIEEKNLKFREGANVTQHLKTHNESGKCYAELQGSNMPVTPYELCVT